MRFNKQKHHIIFLLLLLIVIKFCHSNNEYEIQIKRDHNDCMQATLKSQLQAGVEIFNPLKPNLIQTLYTLGSIRRM